MPILGDWFPTDPKRNNANIHPFLKHSKTPVVFETRPRTRVEKPMDYFKWTYFFFNLINFSPYAVYFLYPAQAEKWKWTRPLCFVQGASLRGWHRQTGESREKTKMIGGTFQDDLLKKMFKPLCVVNSAASEASRKTAYRCVKSVPSGAPDAERGCIHIPAPHSWAVPVCHLLNLVVQQNVCEALNVYLVGFGG